MRVVSWNVARRSSRLAEQAAALAGREPDVVALQEVTSRTLPLWRAALETIGISHVRASLDRADPARKPAARRSTGVLLGSRTPLGDAPALSVPWPETAIAAVSSSAGTGAVELHCVHVPNAANGWVKVRTLEAIRHGLASAGRGPRVLCGDLNTPRRELPEAAYDPSAGPSGTRPNSASFQGCESSVTAMRFEPCTATRSESRAGRGGGSPATTAVGVWITSSHRKNFARLQLPITTHGASRGSATTRRSKWSCSPRR